MIGKKFKKDNLTNALNVLYAKKGKIYPAYISRHNSNREKQVIFLMVSNREGCHYLELKKLSPLLRRITSKNHGYFCCLNYLFLNIDSLHSRLNSHYKAWSYKKKKHKKIKAYRKSLYKEPTFNRCLLILDLKPFRLSVKGKHSIGREFHSVAVRGKKLLA